MTPPRPRFLAITGPTASGKTRLALALAERLPIEIVSMDSRQVYRGMDIGTDKVDPAGRARVPHHGLDLIDPDERYSAGRFARDARRWIAEIEGRGRVPALVGGTGFFLRALTEPIFAEPELDEGRRRDLRRYLSRQDPGRLAEWVGELDPERRATAVPGGRQRMARTLEIALLTGRPLSWWHRAAPTEAPGMPCVSVLLEISREEMNRRIDERVASMFAVGLVEEVKCLIGAGYGEEDPGMTSTGYREVATYLRGGGSLEEATELVRTRTRQYARRQLTWFRHQLPEPTLRLDARMPLGGQVAEVFEAWTAAQRSGDGGRDG